MDNKVLIVTQDTTIATVLNFEVEINVHTCNSRVAEQEVANWFPQVIIIDGESSSKESLKLCTRLKSSKQFCSIPVIFLDNVMNVRQMGKAYKAGVDYFILKQKNDWRALQLTVQSVLSMQAKLVPLYQV
jgi:PleD family two-component response regulator